MVINLSEPRTCMNTRSTIDIYRITKRMITLNAADVTDQIIGYVHRSSENEVLIGIPNRFHDRWTRRINLPPRDNVSRKQFEAFLIRSRIRER